MSADWFWSTPKAKDIRKIHLTPFSEGRSELEKRSDAKAVKFGELWLGRRESQAWALDHFGILQIGETSSKTHCNFCLLLPCPVRLKLKRYRGIQQIIKSYRWTVFVNFCDKNAVFTNFCDKNAVYTSFRDKNCAFYYMTKTQCLALILSVQDKINQSIANLFYWQAICFIDSQSVLSIELVGCR